MIFKERNSAEHRDIDKWSKAGAQAEEKMAFYLRRVFLNDRDIFIFHDLHYKDDTGDSAQIDHLALHRHGFIIIESKSVSTQVAINAHGEWSRLWNGKWEGMPSPIQQAKLQAEFLQRALAANAEALIQKKWSDFTQPKFKKCPFEILIAISDHGSIAREIDLPEVVKADQVPDRIRDIYQRHRKAKSLFSVTTNVNDGIYNFNDDEIKNISNFLVEHHYPLLIEQPATVKESVPVYEAKPTPPPPPQEPAPGLGICSKCGKQCEILWGKFSYFWKCRACGNNMPIKEYCPTCRDRMKLRKEKNKFYIFCDRCKTERSYCEFVEG